MRVIGYTAAAAAAVTLLCGAAAVQDPTIVSTPAERFTMRVVASNLEGPWEIAWGPDDRLWATERQGRRVVRIDPADGSRSTAVTIPEVHQSVTQDGLLGMALHPELLRGTGNDYVYVAFTYDDAPGTALVRRMAIRRYRYDRSTGTMVEPTDLLTKLPVHDDHVGGRLAFGPDRKLYLTIGDQGSNFGENRCNPNRAQEVPTASDVSARDWTKYQGKILRVDLDGSIPADNPVIAGIRSHVFSYGHRNPSGLVFGADGKLYESEHGPNTDDEVNLIEGGRNYGWPHVAGYKDDKTYAYSNWSASSPTPCASLSGRGAVPASVPTRKESEWNDPKFAPPLRTFFTVETGYEAGSIGSATIAPGSIDLYAAGVVPGWQRSLLVLSLIRGTVFRVPLAADGRSVQEPPIALFRTVNRYRDMAISPDGRRVYIATDVSGPYRDVKGGVTQTLANPGSILEFTYNAS